MPLNNLVFISGPQGAGKTTLVKRLLQELPNSTSPELETRKPKFYWDKRFPVKIDHFHRQALKWAQRAIENYEYWRAARSFPEKLVIGDRCIYDTQVFTNMCVQLGWFSQEKADLLCKNLSVLYRPELIGPWAIVLNPGFEISKRHLKARRNSGHWVKFGEKDDGFLKASCEAFKSLRDHQRVLYLEERANSPAIQKIKDWMHSNDIRK